jgi:hypothetical protein
MLAIVNFGIHICCPGRQLISDRLFVGFSRELAAQPIVGDESGCFVELCMAFGVSLRILSTVFLRERDFWAGFFARVSKCAQLGPDRVRAATREG